MTGISPDIGVQGWRCPSIRPIADIPGGLDRAHEGAVALVDACRIAGRQDQFITPTADDGVGRFGGASCRGPCLGHGRGRRQCPAGSR